MRNWRDIEKQKWKVASTDQWSKSYKCKNLLMDKLVVFVAWATKANSRQAWKWVIKKIKLSYSNPIHLERDLL